MNATTAAPATTDVHASALLVDLTICQWTGRKIDKRATEQVAQMNGVDTNVGTYYKSLIDGSALEPLKKLTGAARAYHYKLTLPWSDSGPRVLPTAAYFDYMQQMQQFGTEFEQAYQVFEQDYAFHRQEAQRKLGPLFNDTEYPDLTTLANRFSFRLNVTPLPIADDLRVDLAAEEVERLRAQIQAQTDATMAHAVADIYKRALDVVDAFVTRLANEDNVFRNSLVENAVALVDIMPKLNFTKDPNLDALCARMHDALCRYEPDTLRHNIGVRKATHHEAVEIKKDLMDFFGGNL